MHYTSRYFLFCFLSITLWNCQNPQKEESEILQQQVMAVHDEMMPRMDELYTMKKQLLAKLQVRDSTMQDSTGVHATLQEAIQKVKAGEEAMMTWMRSYQGHSIQDTDSLIVYLKEELPRVAEMKKVMLEGLEAGKEALK
jgi:hypothetical protein